MALKLFVGFDGTITREETGNSFFRRFGGTECDVILRDLHAKKISAQECLSRRVAQMGIIHVHELKQFLRTQALDETFKDCVAFCREHGIELHVVSEWLDYCIREIFESHRIEGVSVFANMLIVNPVDGSDVLTLSVTFPYSDAECTRCACCSRNILLTHAGDDDVIAFIGQGYSDRCPAHYADIVFAKNQLQTFCQKENISYYVYSTFGDVVERLRLILARKTLRKRRRAELRRRQAFMQE